MLLIESCKAYHSIQTRNQNMQSYTCTHQFKYCPACAYDASPDPESGRRNGELAIRYRSIVYLMEQISIYLCDACVELSGDGLKPSKLLTHVYQPIHDKITAIGGTFEAAANWSGVGARDLKFAAPPPTLENLRDMWNLLMQVKPYLDLHERHGTRELFTSIGVTVVKGKLHRIVTEEI